MERELEDDTFYASPSVNIKFRRQSIQVLDIVKFEHISPEKRRDSGEIEGSRDQEDVQERRFQGFGGNIWVRISYA